MRSAAAKFILSFMAYTIPTMILGMVWHFALFGELYDTLGIYNRSEPIIPLGFASMIVQGCIMAYFYPFYSRDNRTVLRGIKYGLIMGLFLYSVSTLANAAKIEVTSMEIWLLVQLAFHLVQFVIAGALIGLIHSRNYYIELRTKIA